MENSKEGREGGREGRKEGRSKRKRKRESPGLVALHFSSHFPPTPSFPSSLRSFLLPSPQVVGLLADDSERGSATCWQEHLPDSKT